MNLISTQRLKILKRKARILKGFFSFFFSSFLFLFFTSLVHVHEEPFENKESHWGVKERGLDAENDPQDTLV